MDYVETIVIGAGVVGLAIAQKLARDGHEVLVIEAETAVGTITSSRNSGVIHAGIYYRPGSLKAKLCVKGRDQLYAYAAARSIPHRQCGKLIVATSEDQNAQLVEWQKIATQNGVKDLRLLTAAEAKAMENELFCTAALYVPITGVIDVPTYILALHADAEAAGASLALKTRVSGGEITDTGFILDIEGSSQISCKTLINAAGLGAQEFSSHLRGLDQTTIPSQVLAKGNYFALIRKQLFSRLIYPLPVPGSSGLHAFCDIDGRVRFGPDVEWVEKIDYRIDPKRAELFEKAVRLYWPGLPSGALQPDFCGIRPKLARGSPHDSDFMVQTVGQHKVSNLINLYGIESPGLTSSLALGDYVADLVEKENG